MDTGTVAGRRSLPAWAEAAFGFYHNSDRLLNFQRPCLTLALPSRFDPGRDSSGAAGRDQIPVGVEHLIRSGTREPVFLDFNGLRGFLRPCPQTGGVEQESHGYRTVRVTACLLSAPVAGAPQRWTNRAGSVGQRTPTHESAEGRKRRHLRASLAVANGDLREPRAYQAPCLRLGLSSTRALCHHK